MTKYCHIMRMCVRARVRAVKPTLKCVSTLFDDVMSL